jgi:excisionase family DNA binding protein
VEPLYFTVDGAASSSGLYREAITKAINIGTLPFIKFGGKRQLIRRDDLVARIEHSGQATLNK